VYKKWHIQRNALFFTDNLGKIIDGLLFQKLAQGVLLLENLVRRIPGALGLNAAA
jgi:hypothetical protein